MNARYFAVELILALRSIPLTHDLPSRIGHGTLPEQLLDLVSQIRSRELDVRLIIPLFETVESNASDLEIYNALFALVTRPATPPRPLPYLAQTPVVRNTSTLINTSEHRKFVDNVLKGELGSLHVGVPGFYDAFFGGIAGLEAVAEAAFEMCKGGNNPLYSEAGGWCEWPKSAKEDEVLKWFAKLVNMLVEFAEVHGWAPNTRRKLLALPNQPLQGSTAERKLDVGFVDDREGSKDIPHWSHVLVPGELKSNPDNDIPSKAWFDLGRYAREVLTAQDTRHFVQGFTLCGSTMRLWQYDRIGAIASLPFDINKDGLQFVSAVLGYLSMNKEQLGFDPTILQSGGKQYIEIVRNDRRECLIIDELMKRAPCVAGRATTCWKAHREGDESQKPLVIKDSWQYPERDEEGELLREATEKGVINVARYYHHETVRVNDKDDDILDNVRKGLDITTATNYKPERSMTPVSMAQIQELTRQSRNTSKKRSLSLTDSPLPPSKRTGTSSPTKGGISPPMWNRVHRRVITRDYGKHLYKASCPAALLTALLGCIEGYESLHTRTGMIQCDISTGNLMMNEDDGNPSWPSFLIDLDLAIKEQRLESSGAKGKTGTRAFMAIGVLYNEKHSFRHDLESFFWVLFWICIHYNGPDKESRVVPDFEEWNYMDANQLARSKKGEVADGGDFISNAEQNFTSYYQPLIPSVNSLRKVVFPGGARWKVDDTGLYSQMKESLLESQKDLKV
ncbi:hypothetical protein OEA41_004719 [Lepraria neglecta]|uniref:Fungal-type protein kinase domain-containing protein n=1 Tax=Lepraria neglecta TaxID=209136 RepID=A0AAD9Z0I8_9LECA|nr:hypothetical protein OEA41_004719 [Lepraria neglecta]